MMSTPDLVWAKMKYCSWWPGLVRATIPKLMKKKGQMKFVYFFGSRNFAWIEEHNLKPYVLFRETLNKPNMSRGFHAAVDRIDEYISDPIKYKVNAEQEFVPKPPARKAPRKMHTIKKKMNTKVAPVVSHRYPKRIKQKSVVTHQLNRPASPLPMRPNEKPIFLESIAQSNANFNLSLKYGVLGLGIMGTKIAENLIKSGLVVSMLDVAEARTALSLSKLIEKVDILFSCISDPLVLREMLKLLTMFKDKGYVQLVCLYDNISQKIENGITDNGGRYLEALVHGSKSRAESETRMLFAAGDRTLYDECQICLQAIAQKMFFLSKTGGALYLVLQMILGTTTAGLAEGMALATKFNLPFKEMLDLMRATNTLSPLLAGKAKAIMNCDFAAYDQLRDTERDLRLAIALGDKLDQPMPITATTSEIYVRSKRIFSEEDSSSVYMKMLH